MELLDFFQIFEYGVLGFLAVYVIIQNRRLNKKVDEKDEYIKELEQEKQNIQDDRISDVKDQLATISALREAITGMKTEMREKLNALRDIIMQRGNNK